MTDTFKNILVTYVRPTNKDTAFNMGLSLAKTSNSKLSVVEFIQEDPPKFVLFKTKKDQEQRNKQKNIVEKALKKFETKAKEENISLKTSFQSTESLVDSIIQYVESNKIDLLIVDHPHLSHSQEVQYNDIVSNIHDEINCHMLTLKQGNFTMKQNDYKKILVLHGGFEAGDVALSHGINLANMSNGTVTVLHVVNVPTYPMNFISSTTEKNSVKKQLRKAALEMKKQMKKEFQKKIEKYKMKNVKISLELVIGPTLNEVLEYETKNNFDLIVMGKSKGSRAIENKSVVGGLTIKLLEQLRCPILVLDVPLYADYNV